MTIKETIKSILFKTMGDPSLWRLIEFPKMLKYLDPKMNESILDIACGTGELTLKIANHGCESYGIDLSPDAINQSKKNSDREGIRCDFQIANAENLPFSNGQFDKVISNCALEHFQNDIKALEEMNRVLKENGELVLSVDSFSYPINQELKRKHSLTYNVVNYYTKESIQKKLIKADFELQESDYIINSKLSSTFFNYLYLKNENQYILVILSIIAYPFCFISDKLFGSNQQGYGLVLKSKKIS